MRQLRHVPWISGLSLVLSVSACGDDAKQTSDTPVSDAGQDSGPRLGAAPGQAPRPDAGGSVLDLRTLAPDGSDILRTSSPSMANVPALGTSERKFAFELYHRLAAARDGQNLLFSPYGISSALAMVYVGAHGTTESELAGALHVELPGPQFLEAYNATDLALAARAQDPTAGAGVALHIDNRLWVQRGFDVVPGFVDNLSQYFGAPLFQLDFASPDVARGTINQWVSQETEQRIPMLLSQGAITSDTRFVITNAIYFDAAWQTKFEPSSTRDATFSKLDGSKLTVPMLNGGFTLPYSDGDGYQALAIPYATQALRLLAILPDEGQFATIEAALSGAWLDTVRAALADTDVAVSLPKLDIQVRSELSDALKALGVHAAFGNADFSLINDDPQLKLTTVVHQASLEVSERGTIAAAATAVVGALDGGISKPHPYVPIAFERPYFVAIIDEPTGALLFLGRVLDPSAK